MQRETSSFDGKIECVGEVNTIERKEKKPFKKRIIGVKKEDGQLAFFESRKDLDKDLPIGSDVTVHYYFAGSIKGEKWYNNAIINHIQFN